MAENRVTIIVPVYGDWASLNDCIDSLKKFVALKHTILLVNDCGPDADELEGNIKRSISGQKNFGYYRNPKNLGFVKTCNRAVYELDKTNNDILLLNSDTKVTHGFLEEMLDVMYADGKIATVSPRSNNATICTVPLSAASQKGIERGKSYKLFLKINDKLPRYSVAPTAHGFCMLIKRSVIKKYGLFDEIFGKGYGEEVDFCQRIAKRGYINVIANQAYVFHLEARSFSLKAKQKMIENNSKIINTRYPLYKQAVTVYIKNALEFEKNVFGKSYERSKIIRKLRRVSSLIKIKAKRSSS